MGLRMDFTRNSPPGAPRSRRPRFVAAVFAAVAAGAAAGSAPLADEASTRMSRGVALLEQFRFSDAAREFERVVELRPEVAAARINLGIAWFNERDFAAARASFQRALELDPGSLHARYNLGLIDKLEGNTEEALEAFRVVAAGDPDDSMTLYYLGAAHAALGRLEEAEAALRQAIALTPDHESAHFSLGNVLLRAGRREEGRAQLAHFQELKGAAAGGVSAGLQYTELGPYAEAVEEAPAPLYAAPPGGAPQPENPAEFRTATAAWGLELPPLPHPPLSPTAIQAGEYSEAWAADHLLPGLGSGVAFRDLDGDTRPELVFVRGGAVWVFGNSDGAFERWPEALDVGSHAVSTTIGDLDLDGDPDIYVAAAGRNAVLWNEPDPDGDSVRFVRARDTGAEDDGVSVGATLADFDHDGDLDIYVANFAPARLDAPAGREVRVPEDVPGAPNGLYRNNGDGSFTDVAEATRTSGGARRSLGSLFADWDDDRDVDFLVVNEGSPVQVFSNDRVGTFTETAALWGVETAPRMRGAASADYDRDGTEDLLLTAEGSALNLLLSAPVPGAFVADTRSPDLLAAGVPGPRYGAAFLDHDLDMDLDLLLAVNGPGAPLALYENTPAGFAAAAFFPAELEPGEEARAVALADVDGDGDLDVLAGTTRGRLLGFENGQTGGEWMAVLPRGLRSNLDGVGTKIEVRVGGVSQRRQVRSTSGYLAQSDLPVHFGLGDASSADYVRFLWPGGVKQIELEVPAAAVARVEELNRKGTSCPVLYAWDGERIRFSTDFLGGSALGNLLAPGIYNTPDTTELVKMETFAPVPRNGAFEFRFVNQLEEVIFYDRAALWIADHPAGVDVFPTERLLPGPPYPPPGLVAVRNRQTPRRAFSAGPGGREREVTAALAEVDRSYVDDFELLPFKGYAETHALTLEFDGVRPDARHVLLLYGWVDYADSSSNLAASQSGVAAAPPVLEIGGPDGFRRAVDRMGFPAGLPKTMVVPLDEIPLPAATAFRITTNMRIYWDRIELAEVAEDAGITVSKLDPADADLRFAGYPEPHRPEGSPPTEYVYERRRPTDVWGAHEGDYTRFGDVRPLLAAVDDRYVITRHGDEIALRFDAEALPPLPEQSRRSFFVFADGFGKDMDLNSARPHTVGPLPFHAMPGYPYPESAGPDPGGDGWGARWNTRRIGPEGRHGFLDGGPGPEPTGAPADREDPASIGEEGPGARRDAGRGRSGEG